MKIVDLKLNIDGLILADDESVDDYIKSIQGLTNSNYKIVCEVLHEEIVKQ